MRNATHTTGRTIPWGWPRLAAFCLASMTLVATAADWPTYRGSAQRTGNVDGKPGPAAPKALWVHRATDHFIASPVTIDGRVFVSGLAAFNTSSFQALDARPQAKDRVMWAKSAPYLKLPTVCPPVSAGNLLVFGDGMHQTDGAVLHALRLDNGLPQWQLPVPGTLVHLESSATIAAGKVFIGGGAAGVIAIDPSKLELDGKPVDAAAAQALLDKRWKELVAKYEQEKKVDPDFAIPPSDDSLPKPRPTIAWQQGAGQWHVDAPLTVANDKVLVASARLDLERVGDRALIGLRVADGATAWKVPLRDNPWGGATLAGDLALVGCSSIRLEAKEAAHGKGEVVAVQVADGAVKWRRDVPGGVVSSIAVRDGLAVFTATDGRVRGWDAATGREKWSYDAQAPLFAPPAVSGDRAYVADLKGVVHGIKLADGTGVWKFDIGTNPQTKAPGLVFGGPTLADGKLFVATCNIDSADRRETVVVCLGD